MYAITQYTVKTVIAKEIGQFTLKLLRVAAFAYVSGAMYEKGRAMATKQNS